MTWAAEVEDLVNEVEIAFEIRGIDDTDDAVRLRGVLAAAEEHIAQDGFIRRAGGERVRTRQIDDLDRPTMLL